MHQMELLAPAGDMNALIAAIENGADAVYLGAKDLSARRGAGNFDADEMKFAADYCHERGKRVHVTVNTVLKQSERGVLAHVAEQLARAGVDAAIVQDFGVARALHAMLPTLALHASTQMAIHNPQGCVWAMQNGFARVVLAREATYEEIAACAETGVEIEAFCHGALCVACSGQCLFSSIIGGRSGNRGACAQPCRLPYTLVGGRAGTEGYLLSPKDLMTLPDLAAFARAGVKSLKIEGRLKRPEYVAVVTRAYRRALDGEAITREDLNDIAQVFNRGGFTPGYGPGVRDGELISVSRPNHAGVIIGSAQSGYARLTEDVLTADEIVVRAPEGADTPIHISGRAGESVRIPKPVSGDIYRLVSDAQIKRARESFSEIKPCVPVRASLRARVGEKLTLSVDDGVRRVNSYLDTPIERADKQISKHALDERIYAQINKTGGTPYRMDEIVIDAQADAFLPASTLNNLRRTALNALRDARVLDLRGCEAALKPLPADAIPNAASRRPARLVAESACTGALSASLRAGADEIAYVPDDLRIAALDQALCEIDTDFYLSLPPVLSGAALNALHQWTNAHSAQIQGVYITNIAQLALSWPGETRLDYALNIANTHAMHALGAQARIFTPSVELTAREISELGGKPELLVYGRVPLMHLRHCPLNASYKGALHADCHRCDGVDQKNQITKCVLVDRKRARFPLSRVCTGFGCVIDVNNCVPLMLLRHIQKLPAADGWRMRFTDESDARVGAITRQYRLAMDGKDFKLDEDWYETDGGEATTGHYFRGVE